MVGLSTGGLDFARTLEYSQAMVATVDLHAKYEGRSQMSTVPMNRQFRAALCLAGSSALKFAVTAGCHYSFLYLVASGKRKSKRVREMIESFTVSQGIPLPPSPTAARR